jgi:general secretion pathway protein E
MNLERRIEDVLLARGWLSTEQLRDVRAAQAERGGSLAEAMARVKGLDPDLVLRATAEILGLPYLEKLPADRIEWDLVAKVPGPFARRHLVVCYGRENGSLLVATAAPLDFAALDDVRLFLDAEVRAVVVPPAEITAVVNTAIDRAGRNVEDQVDKLEDLEHEGEIEDDLLADIGEDEDAEAPIIRLVNSLIFQAAKEKASDIHIEPFENEIAVRFRIDGVLYEITKPPKRFHNSIITRVKILAQLNIAEKRLPQDGRIRVKMLGKDIDIRTSVIPTAYGERVVMRLLDKTAVRLDLEELGFHAEQLRTIEKLIRKSHGILLVTGPTGSGKTTTLYAALSRINTPDKNILTVEDPIEYQLKGIGQMQVQPKINLTFANGLRSFLRQDPDIIMVGEIRDAETADIAIHASLTGHLVFSTLHTNDAAGAVARLLDMGIEPFLVSSSLVAVIAQRLVRVLCPECRAPYAPTAEELAEIGLSAHEAVGRQVYHPTGCPACLNRGYRGRTAIYEILLVSDEVRNQILKHTDASHIRRQAVAEGMKTLRDDGARKVLEGVTSIEEVLAVTQEDAE